MAALRYKGPVGIGVDASAGFFQHYEGGIIRSARCGTGETIGHAVTAVGYGMEGDEEYIIVKNSWGDDWGE